MEVEAEVSENTNMENMPVRDHQAGDTLEVENCLESLEENLSGDSPVLIQPAVQVKQTPLRDKTPNANWFNDISEQWKNRRGKQSQETGHFPGKENQLEAPNKPSTRAYNKRAAKESHQPTPGKRKLPDTKRFWNGDNNKKARFIEDQCDQPDKQNCTETFEKPQTRNNPKNAEYTEEANLHPESKCIIQFNTKSRVITFMDKRKEINRSVEGNNTVIYYAKKSIDSENIILYSSKLEAIINPFVPCCVLEEGEKIEIIRRKKFKNKKTILSLLPDSNYNVCGKGIFFKVQCKGYTEGDGPRHVLRDGRYTWKKKPLAVYGRADQTIEEAIQNDKRFDINSKFGLKNPNKAALDEWDIPLSFLDPDVVYTIQVTNYKKPNSRPDPKTQKSVGLQRSDERNKDFQIRQEVPQTSSVPQSEPEIPEICQTPKSEEFSSAFNNVSNVERKQMISDMIKDYSHNVMYKEAMLATTHRLLTQHLDSVGLIKFTFDREVRSGTFFLLTENLGLTCHHVLKFLIESGFDWKHNPIPNGEVVFNYESESAEPPDLHQCIVTYYNETYDFAFVQISPEMPGKGLLKYVALPPEDGAVSIIGHPGGLYKKIDPMCSVVNFSKRADTIANTIFSDKSYIQVLLKYSFNILSSKHVTYDTCLYEGASGGPVFDDRGGLVAMHCGGYLADTHLNKKSIIEYGVNIVDILICGSTQIRELCSSFYKVIKCNENLDSYMMKYTEQGAHSDTMQPVIRTFLTRVNDLIASGVKPQPQLN